MNLLPLTFNCILIATCGGVLGWAVSHSDISSCLAGAGGAMVIQFMDFMIQSVIQQEIAGDDKGQAA